MIAIISMLIFFSSQIFSNEVVVLSIEVRGRVISKEEKIVKELEKGLQEIRLTNCKPKDIYVYGKANKKPFLYKITSGVSRVYKVKAEKIDELYYMYEGKRRKLEKYSDL